SCHLFPFHPAPLRPSSPPFPYTTLFRSRVLRTSMELGGNAPFIVFEDADVDKAVEGALLAKFRNIGQACTAANRFLVHADVAEEFTRRIVERVKSFKVGRGTEEGVTIGPLIDDRAVAKVE